MKDIPNKWVRQLALTKAFLGGCIALLVIGGIGYEACRLAAQDGCIVRHSIFMEVLEHHIASGGHLPINLLELAELERVTELQKYSIGPSVSFEKERRDLQYYPDAWKKPGKIIFQSSVLGSYVVTFGDGSRAVLSRYYDYPEHQPDQPLKINKSAGKYRLQGRGFLGTVPVLVLLVFLLVTFIILAIVERVMKKRVRQRGIAQP